MEVMILNFNPIRESKLFNGNPSDTFKDLGKQVFNYFATPSFVTNIYETDELYYLEAELAKVQIKKTLVSISIIMCLLFKLLEVLNINPENSF